MSKDYYNILGVSKTASQEEIKKTFREKAHQFHPDKAGGDEAKFKEVNEAYQVLGDREKRSQYDQFGSSFENMRGQGGFQGFDGWRDFSGAANGFNVNAEDLGDIFGGIGDIFGFGGGRGRSRTVRGQDLQMMMTIDFREAVFGTEKTISLNKQVVCEHCKGNTAEPGSKIETCPECQGSGRVTRVQRTILGNMQVQATCERCRGEGKSYEKLCTKCDGTGVEQKNTELKVKIPAGINDNETIRLTGQGEAGQKGAHAGDLYLQVNVTADPDFKREGFDINTITEISFTQAALGDKIEVNTVHGGVKLKIPAGAQSGTVFKLRGKGVPKLSGSGQGDHFVTVNIKTPKNLNRKQKEGLKELNL